MANLLRKPVFIIALMRGEDSVVGQIEAEFCTALASLRIRSLHTEVHGGHVTVHFWFLLESNCRVSLTLSVH